MRVLSTSKKAAACGSGTMGCGLTSAAAAAAAPAATAAFVWIEDAAALVRGGDPAASPEESWRLGSAVTVVEPNGYSCEI
jgi:hypothetical protein